MGFVFLPPAALLLAWLAQSGLLSQAPHAIGVLLRIPSAVFAAWMIVLAGSTGIRLFAFGLRWIGERSALGRDDFRLALLELARLPLYLLLFWWLASASQWWGLRPTSVPINEGRPSPAGNATPAPPR